MKKSLYLLSILMLTYFNSHGNVEENRVDICIYGGTSAGVVAAYTAANAGKKVLIIESGNRLGGLSSGGLGQTDIGNKYVVTGLALDFYRKLGQHYGNLESWVFEPKIAQAVFNEYVKSAHIRVIYKHQLLKIEKEGLYIKAINIANLDDKSSEPIKIEAKMFIDCSYEGDLMAKSGVFYVIGREDNNVYHETLNGVQLLERHQFPDGVDPYKVKGNASSGLLWGISAEVLEPNGTGDKKVQAYNFRITLTSNPLNKINITKPDNYNPNNYELLIRQKEIQPWVGLNDIFIWSLMPDHKTDINNRNGMSTDMIGANWDYPSSDYLQRKIIIKAHEDYTKGLLYFVGNDSRIPEFIKMEMQQWGYPKDEFLDNNHWSPQLYIREARRLVGDIVMTQNHCQGREVITDDIAYAAYTMDSHNCNRLVVKGMVKNEGNVEVGGFPPFPISYRAIIPQKKQVNNLLIPVCLSASHIAFGSIRMEPVFMVMAQSAAVAACLAFDKNIAVQDVDVNEIKSTLKLNPKADFRKPDIISQVADDSGIEIKGEWKNVKLKGYGKFHLESEGDEKGNYVKFSFDLKSFPGRYKAYYYYPKSETDAKSISLELFNGREMKQLSLNLGEVEILGQTISTWVALGEFDFDFAAKSYFKILTNGTSGKVAANAILLVPNVR
jgi:hypothetical protein